MGFCGCSLFSSTVWASIFGIVLSIYHIAWRSFFLNLSNNKFESSKLINNILQRLALLSLDKVVKPIVIASLAIHTLWALSSFFLIIGNQKRVVSTLRFWVLTTALVIISDISFVIYFLINAFKSEPTWDILKNFWNDQNLDFSKYIIIAALFDKGIIILCILIALMVYVNKRANEILKEIREESDHSKNKRIAAAYTNQNMDYPEPSHTKYIPHVGSMENNSNQRIVNYSPQYDRNNYPGPQYTQDRNNYPGPQYTHDRNNYPGPQYTHDRNNYPGPQYTYDRNNYPPSYHAHSQRNEGFQQFQVYGERVPEPEIDYDIDRNKSSYYRENKRY